MSAKVAWQTEALIARGEEAQAAGQQAIARECFSQALAHLDDHRATRFNLAVSLLHLGEFEEAAGHFDRLKRDLREDDVSGLRLPVLYNAAVASAALADAGDAHIDAALEDARTLVAEIIVGSLRRRRRDKALLSRLEGPAIGLLATLLRRADTLADTSAAPVDRRDLLARLRAPSWRAQLSPAALAAFAEAEHGSDARTRYELARYRVAAESSAAAADTDLRLALSDQLAVAQWADADPLLRPPKPRPEPRRPARSPDPAAEELRVILAMEGGLERAAWLGGCAMEFDAARWADPGVDRPRTLYGLLCQAFERELVVDVYTSAGAGVANAALLARADRPLSPAFVRALWLDLADAPRLLAPLSAASPPAIAQAQSLAVQLQFAFEDLSQHGPPRPLGAFDVTLEDERRSRRRVRLNREDFAPHTLAQLATASLSRRFAFASWKLDYGLLRRIHPGHGDGEFADLRETGFFDAGRLDADDLQLALDVALGLPAHRVVARYVCSVGDHPRDLDLATDAAATIEALMELDRDVLAATAAALFTTYCERRIRSSLAELVDEPDTATEKVSALPWIPRAPGAPPPGEWGWGIRPAQRIGHLLLDLLRPRLALSERYERAHLLELRSMIEAQLERLAALVGRIDSTNAFMDALSTADSLALREIVDSMLAAAEREKLIAGDDPLGRLLDIEVVRRATNDLRTIDSAQPVLSLSITPSVRVAILSSKPLRYDVTSDPTPKLTGHRREHFTYRALRANDFLWGRLDAAAGVIDLLVDGARADALDRDAKPPWSVLADALGVLESPEDRLLMDEALEEAGDREQDLASILRLDLLEDGGRLTRIICTRARQLEILREEWPAVVHAAAEDAEAGAPVTQFLPLELSDVLALLRDGRSLPEILVAADATASRSALRSDLQAARNALAALRLAGLPFGGLVATARVVLAPTAATLVHPLVALAAYWVAALFVGARVASTEDVAERGALISGGTLIAIASTIVIVGVASVPAIMAARARALRRLRHAAAALGVLLAAGAAAALLALVVGGLSPAQILAAPRAIEPPTLVTLLVAVALAAGLALGRRRPSFRGLSLVLVLVPAIAVAAASLSALASASDDGAWKLAVAVVAIVGPPVAFLAAGIGSGRFRRV